MPLTAQLGELTEVPELPQQRPETATLDDPLASLDVPEGLVATGIDAVVRRIKPGTVVPVRGAAGTTTALLAAAQLVAQDLERDLAT